MDRRTAIRAKTSRELVQAIQAQLEWLDEEETFVIFDLVPPATGIRYVQVMRYRGDSVVLESVSNRYIAETPESTPLDESDEGRLGALGFARPESTVSENWELSVHASTPGWPMIIAEATMKTLIDVHRWTPGTTVEATVDLCRCSPRDPCRPTEQSRRPRTPPVP